MDTIIFLRQFRLGSYAIFDFTASFLAMALLAPLLSSIFCRFGIEIPKRNWVFFTLPLSIATHMVFGAYTPMTRAFFDPNAHYFLKLTIILLASLSFMDIKRLKRRP